MDDRERIEALVVEGRITREEGDRLLGVLDDIDSTERNLEGVDAQVSEEAVRASQPSPEQTGPAPASSAPRTEEQVTGGETRRETGHDDTHGTPPRPRTPPVPPIPPRPHQGPAPQPDAGPERSGDFAPEGMRWVDVRLLAGDLEIEAADDIETPEASSHGAGETVLEPTDSGFRFDSMGPRGGSILSRVISGVTRGRTTLRVPSGWGVRLDMKAGDVKITGPLAYLTGNLMAGDIDARELLGVDLQVSAGDIDLGLRVSEGRSRVRAVAGDLNIRLLPGSSSRVHGHVNIGDLSVPEGWTLRRRGLGHEFEATLGSGTADLALELGTGDLDVEEVDA